jgi:hypothetical protein
MTKEEVMEMYPPGTVIHPILKSGRHSPAQYTVKEGQDLYSSYGNNVFWYSDMTDPQHLIYNGKNAKIISKPAEASKPKSPIEFKVGDKVTITKGTSSWNSNMDQYVGKQATLIRLIFGESFAIDLDGGMSCWYPQHGHFVKYEEAKPAVDILKEGDEILFNTGISTLRYEVRQCYCYCVGGDNTKVFDQLGVDNIYTLATECYRYKAGPGSWPECKNGDYAALTRLVNKLHELCAKATKPKAEVKPVLPTKEYLEKMYPVGTVFKPLGTFSTQTYTVREGWVIDSNSRGDGYWFCSKYGHLAHSGVLWLRDHPDKYTQIVSKGPSVEVRSSTQQHSLINNPYEKPIEHPKAVFLQRVNLQVRQGNPSRGVGLKSTVSQIRLGSNSCYHQERSSRS